MAKKAEFSEISKIILIVVLIAVIFISFFGNTGLLKKGAKSLGEFADNYFYQQKKDQDISQKDDTLPEATSKAYSELLDIMNMVIVFRNEAYSQKCLQSFRKIPTDLKGYKFIVENSGPKTRLQLWTTNQNRIKDTELNNKICLIKSGNPMNDPKNLLIEESPSFTLLENHEILYEGKKYSVYPDGVYIYDSQLDIKKICLIPMFDDGHWYAWDGDCDPTSQDQFGLDDDCMGEGHNQFFRCI